MSDRFFEQPILNSPYESPAQHWELDEDGQPTNQIISRRRQNEAARLWISGLEIVQRQLEIQRVYDLSATPFFLRGSGYAEGTLFPWTVSDFSLMDAIECGIVKLPRVPVADNVPGGEMPKFRKANKHSEFRDGEIVEMTGGIPAHNWSRWA